MEKKDIWVVDIEGMACKNMKSHIVVVFEKKRGAITGRIETIPPDLLTEWTRKPNGACLMKETIHEAEKVFFNAYFTFRH